MFCLRLSFMGSVSICEVALVGSVSLLLCVGCTNNRRVTTIRAPAVTRSISKTSRDSGEVIFASSADDQPIESRMIVSIIDAPIPNESSLDDPTASADSSPAWLELKPNESVTAATEPNLWSRIVADHQNYYSTETLVPFGIGLAAGGIVANTSLDEAIRHKMQQNIRSASTDEWYEWLHANKELGNGRYTMPVMAAAMLTGYVFDDLPLANVGGEWGERSLRAILVGAPPMLAMQRITGASRPGENSNSSHWEPFHDVNGVSGHSFMGAIPFLAAAKQADNHWLKTGLYAGSALAGLSRVNDDGHYASQAFLGWWMAYLATEAVDRSEDETSHWHIVPLPAREGTGMAFERRW